VRELVAYCIGVCQNDEAPLQAKRTAINALHRLVPQGYLRKEEYGIYEQTRAALRGNLVRCPLPQNGNGEGH
jgi:hypothetical protein